MPGEPQWIPESAVEAIHLRQLSEHGGSDGVRDAGMLASALGRPRNQFANGEPAPDLCALGAAYAFGIARNHPFVDGNKRTALVVCRAFLQKNGLSLEASREALYLTFLALAEGSLDEDQLAEWLREHTTK